MSGTWAVSGSAGFLGRRLCARLGERGGSVRRLQRAAGGPDCWSYDLRGEPPAGALEGVDALVHCAWDLRARGAAEIERVNVQGSCRLLAAARRAGVRKLVFVSSASAYPGCRSLYGRSKLSVENDVLRAGGAVLRPGLIYDEDPGGLSGTLERLTALPVLPVLSGGRQPLFLVHRDDLAGLLVAAAATAPGSEPEPLLAAHPEPVAFRDILSGLAARRGRRPRLLSVPAGLAFAVLRAAEAVGLRPAFRSDSLLGLLYPNPEPRFVVGLDGRPVRRFADWVGAARHRPG